MSLYQKFLIIVAIIGIIGIPIFVLNHQDLSWEENTEAYWGLISMIALIAAVIVYRKSEKLEEKVEKPKLNQQQEN